VHFQNLNCRLGEAKACTRSPGSLQKSALEREGRFLKASGALQQETASKSLALGLVVPVEDDLTSSLHLPVSFPSYSSFFFSQ